MSATLRRLFNIQSGEGQLTFLLFAEMFLLGIGFNFVETAVFPLFLTEFSAATLPYLYIINGLSLIHICILQATGAALRLSRVMIPLPMQPDTTFLISHRLYTHRRCV